MLWSLMLYKLVSVVKRQKVTGTLGFGRYNINEN